MTLTDVEFAAIRYSGRAAHTLRVIRGLYLGLPINAVIGGGVTLGMVKILEGTLGVGQVPAVLVCFAVTALYTTLGGFLGVLWTDFFQFLLAMTGSVVLAWYSVQAVGGLSAIPDGLARVHGPASGSLLTFLPAGDTAFLPLVTLAAFLTVQWWAASYPGAEPGGGGYVAQRMLAARDERASVGAVLLFNVLHYTLRPWPWILTALASMIVFAGDPGVAADPETGYVRMLTTVLPPGWRGVLLAALLAAYMSTVATQVNWGASYLVNDVYRPYLRPGRDERHHVLAARAASLLVLALGGIVALRLGRVTAALDWLVSIGAGTGLVLILRWYWWRVNAWSEIAAMIAAGVTSLVLRHLLGPAAFGLGPGPRDAQVFFAYSLVLTTAIVTVTWLAVTWLTPPTDMATLVAFYRRTRPGVMGWGPVAALAPEVTIAARPAVAWLHWVLGCASIYLSLFGTGQLLLGSVAAGVLMIGGAAACGGVLLRGLGRGEATP
jgi:Na+/proline symporter